MGKESEPCDEYRLDMSASEFGACSCGKFYEVFQLLDRHSLKVNKLAQFLILITFVITSVSNCIQICLVKEFPSLY